MAAPPKPELRSSSHHRETQQHHRRVIASGLPSCPLPVGSDPSCFPSNPHPDSSPAHLSSNPSPTIVRSQILLVTPALSTTSMDSAGHEPNPKDAEVSLALYSSRQGLPLQGGFRRQDCFLHCLSQPGPGGSEVRSSFASWVAAIVCSSHSCENVSASQLSL